MTRAIELPLSDIILFRLQNKLYSNQIQSLGSTLGKERSDTHVNT